MALDTSKSVLQSVGKYELFEKIAEGGMGTVYKARDTSNGQTVAIKIVPPQVAKNPVLMKRFEQEYAVANALNHQNIVRALDFGNDGSSPFLVMEYVDGESLGQRVERDGAIPEAEALRLIGQVAQALHKAHKLGLIHRDVKPDNILVTVDGTAKLADLGLVKELETDLNLTRTGRGLGTPHFMAPEQFRNAKNADVRCDIYSLAATLYNMLTGELPFKSTGPLDAWMKKINNELVPARQLVPDLSERVDWALRRAMSVDKDQRPANCREFVEDLTGHSTRKITPSAEMAVQDVWYLFYTDDENVTRTVKGTLQGIRRSLKEGVLGDAGNIRAARSKSGPFEALRKHAEFRDVVLQLEKTTPPKTEDAVRPQQPAGVESSPAIGPRAITRDTPPAGAAVAATRAKVPTPQPVGPSAPPVLLRRAPHILLGTTSKAADWLKWAVLFFCALCLGAMGYFVLPLLNR
jgi:eukaryotic-like serine/threonine-protein kinase